MRRTGIDKRPAAGPVAVRDPGPKTTGLGSGVVGDYIGDVASHGGSDRGDLRLRPRGSRHLVAAAGPPAAERFFGENLTIAGLDVNQALLGEQWQVGDTVVLQVTCPRIPCSTFRGWVGERGWLKTFTADARPGAYLRVVTPGELRGGDAITVVRRPRHEATVSLAYRAMMTEPQLMPAGARRRRRPE